MSTGDILDVSWQLPQERKGEIVVRRADGEGEKRVRRFSVGREDSLEALPEDVQQIVEEDGRPYGVWTRR